jgi:acyl carrier protein
MLDKTSNMPNYQWKLTIVERNLLLSNWMKLIPEAQEQMLWEADELMEDLLLPDRQRLLRSLETLQDHIAEDLQQKIKLIFSSHLNLDFRQALELTIQNTTSSVDGLAVDSSALVESVN